MIEVLRVLLNRIGGKRSFARNVLQVAGGILIGQGIGVVVTPLLTRLYPPEAMGVWGMLLSFTNVSVAVGSLRYEVSIVAANDDKEAASLAVLAAIISAFVSALVVVVFEIFRRFGVLGYNVFPWWSGFVVGLIVISTVWGEVFRYWFIRQKDFFSVAYFSSVRGIFRATFQSVFFWLKAWGLIIGEVFGRFLVLIVLLRKFHASLATQLREVEVNVLRKYIRFPLVFIPSTFVNQVALMAPVPVFAHVYGLEAGGMLSLAQRVVSVPMIFIGNAISDVFYGEISETFRANRRGVFVAFLSRTGALLVLSLTFGVILWLAAPRMVPFIFGRKWALAGEMISVMVPWFVGMLTVSPLSRFVFVSRHPWIKIVYDFLALFSISLPLWVRFEGVLTALRFVAWAEAICYVIYWCLLMVSAYIESKR